MRLARVRSLGRKRRLLLLGKLRDSLAEQGDCEDWLHTDDGQDYCTKHWHWDDEHGRVPGPEPKEEA